MLVVADTSPINYLILIHQDTLLPLFYERVVIPPAVRGELQRPRTPTVVREWMAHPPAWLTVRQPQQRLEAEQFPKLGAGEKVMWSVLAYIRQNSLSGRFVFPDGRKYWHRAPMFWRIGDDRCSKALPMQGGCAASSVRPWLSVCPS
jgi:hypothetical protein